MKPPDLDRMEHRLPIVARWTLYALGAVEGQRVRRPRDPVAAWLLRRHPRLLPTFAAPSILAMLRARTALVDRMLEEEVHRARARGEPLTYFGFGGGFDARWYRLRPAFKDVIVGHCEIEDPDLLDFKHRVLADSSFAGTWDRVHRVPVHEDRWTIHGAPAERSVVVLEGVAARIGSDGLKRVLRRVRQDAPHSSVILDLPGIAPPDEQPVRAVAVGSVRSRWASPGGTAAAALTTRDLRLMGWSVDEDLWMSARPELRAPSGMAICSGMEAFRVLRLRPDG